MVRAIEYEVEGKRGPARYRLIRHVSERVDSGSRGRSTAHLYELLSTGANELTNVNAYLAAHMPAELREVFFTDGDRALSFIEGSRTEQQKRVKLAIEQMMGLPMLDDAVDHIKKVEKEMRLNRKCLISTMRAKNSLSRSGRSGLMNTPRRSGSAIASTEYWPTSGSKRRT